MAKVVSCGIHIADVLGRPVSGIPEGQNLTILEEIRLTVAGTAAGTSVDLAKLGMEVYASGAIGKDNLGDFIVSTMKGFGIDTAGLVRKSEAQTSSTMLPIRPNGERPALHVPGASRVFRREDIDPATVAAADFLHIGGTPLMADFDGEPMRDAFKYAKEQGVTTTYDLLAMNTPDLKEKVELCLPWVDYFMPGLEEAAIICSLSRREDVIRYFLDKGAKHTVLKMGGEGSSIAWYENGGLKEIRIPAFKAEVVDSTGCGDAYCAGFITGLALGWDLEHAGRLGAAAGALVIQGLGSDAGIVSREDTIRFMEETETLPL